MADAMKHKPLKHVNCQKPYCGICEGGLIICTVCGGAEGSLPTECPGRQMTEQEADAVYAGRLDFVHGAWSYEVARPTCRHVQVEKQP
jgi:hypothetical protein